MPPAFQTVASTGVFVAAFAAASGIAVAPPARAQCASTATSAITEARAARWIIGEDLHARAVTDQSRALVTQQLADHGVAAPRWQPFADAALGYQGVLGLAACSAGSERNVALERFRLTGAAGLTHTASGFGVELSFVGARDQLVQSVGSEGDRDVLAGFGQGLVALRAGHEAWGRVLVGFTSPERRDRTLSLDPGRQPGTGQAFFYGVSVPALHLGVVTLAQRGAPELVQISAYELVPPVLPVAVSLGPTYIREERQTVGWLRIRGVGLGGRTAPAATFAEDGTTAGTASQTRYLALVLEASAESREARLRHGRFRIEGALRKTFVGRAGSSLRRLAWISGHLEATVFRSRYFQDALAGSAQRAPDPAWGVGGEPARAPESFAERGGQPGAAHRTDVGFAELIPKPSRPRSPSARWRSSSPTSPRIRGDLEGTGRPRRKAHRGRHSLGRVALCTGCQSEAHGAFRRCGDSRTRALRSMRSDA